jgi:cytoskeletal protein CcmA (bactofilin family)
VVTRSFGAALVVVFVTGMPLAAMAFVIQTGETVKITDGLRDDLYAAGQAVTVSGRLDGDVAAVGRVVTITGAVTGGILAAGQEVQISGGVGRTVRAVGQSVAIENAVGSDVLVAGEEINIRPQVRIGRDLLASGETVYVAGDIGRFARVLGDSVVISGRVGKGLRVDARRLTIMPTARIDGDVRYSAELPADIRPGAIIKGRIERVARPPQREVLVLGVPVSDLLRVWEGLALLLLGLVVVTVVPQGAREIATTALRRFPHSLVAGIAVLVAVPVVSVVLLATVIGIPLAAAMMLLLAAVVYPAQVFVAAALGKVLLIPIGRRKTLSTSIHLMVAVGTVILAILFALPYGWVVRLVAMASGCGALCLTVWQSIGGWKGITSGLRPSP